jgi:hypothetical protein
VGAIGGVTQAFHAAAGECPRLGGLAVVPIELGQLDVPTVGK